MKTWMYRKPLMARVAGVFLLSLMSTGCDRPANPSVEAVATRTEVQAAEPAPEHSGAKEKASGKIEVKPKVLFLCTGNSCRSQMAEGWARQLLGDRIEPYSAGIEAHGLNPNAVRVMKEAGVDISKQTSKLASSLVDVPFDLVITVCGHADENCPAFLSERRVVHVGFDDPPKLAKTAKTEEEGLMHYRRVRDEIRKFVADKLVGIVEMPGSP